MHALACLQKLNTTCHQMQQRIVTLLQQGIPDESLICTATSAPVSIRMRTAYK